MTVVAVYVDDIVITGSSLHYINSLKEYLHNMFSVKDLGYLHYFLGLEATHFSYIQGSQ